MAGSEEEQVAPIVSITDIARPPEEVFSYITDPARFSEWQQGVTGGQLEGDGPPSVGSICTMTRRMGGAEHTITSEITEISPPKMWVVRGIDGPIRATISVAVEPLDKSQRSRVTVQLDFEGHGISKLITPMVVRQAQKEAITNSRKLKERLEGSGLVTP
jgi:uncharacterized protein YndB with AHSA1/START domain